MSDNLVTSAVQDKFDFVWFAGKHGLMRYNGYEFSTFQQTAGDTASLSNNHVRSLFVCSDGRLAVGTARGLNIYQHSNNSFNRLLYKANKFNSGAANVSALTEDLHGTIWVGTSNQQGLYSVRKSDGAIQNWRNRIPTDKILLSNTILALCCDFYGVLWIGTDQGLMTYDVQHNQWQRFDTQSNIKSKGLQCDAIMALFVDEQNNVWIGSSCGLFCYDRKEQNFVRFTYTPQPNIVINQITSINENTLAVATNGAGLLFFNTIVKKWTALQHNPLDPQSLSSNTIQSVLKDREGNWWIAAGTYGLDVKYNQKSPLNSYVSNPKNQQSLSFSSVTFIYEDSYRHIWVGTDGGGLNMFDKQTETFRHYLHNPQNIQTLGSNTVTSMVEDAAGVLWVGTNNGGLHIFNAQRGTFTRLQHDAANYNSLSNNNVSDVFADSAGVIWIATLGGGVDAYSSGNKTFVHYKIGYGKVNSISSNYISSICQDMQGNLWFGTQGNFVDRFNLRTKTFYHYGADKGVVSEYINTVMRTNDGSVWLATANGLNKYDATKDVFVSYKQSSGLPSNEILGLTEAAGDTLWVATSKGLCLFNYNTKKTEYYNVFDGLLSNSINPRAILLASDAQLYLGSPLGLNRIKPHQLQRKTFTYPLLITDLQVFKNDSITSLVHKDLLKSDDLRLSYAENNLAIDYQALSINNAKNMRYAYKLEGLHNNWVQAGNQRRAIFIKLKEGHYTFRLKAFVDDHELTQQVAISFSVAPPWWRSWWMYIIYLIAWIGALYFIWQFSVLKIKTNNKIALEQKEREKLVEVFNAKMNLFTEISHDIRTPLTLVIEPINELIDSQTNKHDNTYKQLERISVNAQKILNLTNQLLDFRRLDAGSISLQSSEYDIVAFCKTTIAAFTDISRQRNLKLDVQSTDPQILLWFDADKLEKVLDNLLANAIKYTPIGGSVQLHITRKTDAETLSVRRWFKKQIIERQVEYVQISVSDTGCGIRADKLPHIFDRFYNIEDSQQSDKERGHGLGLFIVKHLVELHYGSIAVESTPEKGSTFTIQLPVGNAHLRSIEIVASPHPQISVLPTNDLSAKVELNDQQEYAAKPVLLVVDDERDIVTFIAESFGERYHIISCSNGKEAQSMAIQMVPDVVIADVMMPFMDGFELCANLKKDIITSHIPVILLTARNLHESKLKGFESGADAYLTKPFSMKELTVRIESLLENRRRLTNYFKQANAFTETIAETNFIKPLQDAEVQVADPFIEKANQIISKYFNDPDFSVVKFAEEMYMSRSQLFRKLKAVADVTPNDYIRTFRLQHAAQLLRTNHHLSISEIAYEVGFTSLQYFSSCFQKYYGMTPSEYARQEVNS